MPRALRDSKQLIAAAGFVLASSIALWPGGSPIRHGTRPKNLGDVSAGEGPAWDGKGNLYFTGRAGLSRRDSSGATQVVRAEGGPNGLLFDPQGRLLVCESRNRRVTRTEP